MVDLLHRRFASRPLGTAGLLLACGLVVVVLGGVALSFGRLLTFVASADRFATTKAAAGPADQVAMHFRFRGRTRFVRVSIDSAELDAARTLDTSRVFSSVGLVRDTYVRNLVAATSRSRTVGQIADELRSIRNELGLDDDAYVELIARFVQEIPYGIVDTEVRTPVEIAASGSGVCDDKSVLLASLLVHEGYDTAVWAFDSQAHAAVGVRCLGPGMRGSGYAYIETTVPAYVGQVGGTLGSFAAWRRSPQLIWVGGTARYTADLESAFVARTLERARWSARLLEPYLDRVRNAPPRWRDEYAAAAARQVAAHQLASRLALAGDDRERAYALLTSGVR